MKLFVGYALFALTLDLGTGWRIPEEEASSKQPERSINETGGSQGNTSELAGRVAPPNYGPIRTSGASAILNRPGTSNVNNPASLIAPGGPILNPGIVPIVPGPAFPPGSTNTLQVFFPPIIITVDQSSQLYVPPGAEGRITVNLRNDGIGDFFFVSGADDKGFFIAFDPPQVRLEQGQNINVAGRIRVPVFSNAATSLLTIIVQRRTDSTLSRRQVFVRTKSEPLDNYGPWCTMKAITRCDDYLGKDSNCNQRYWNFRAEIQDTDAGLLSVSLKPEGRFIGEDFIVGTNQSVAVEQSVSCCTTAVDIKAVDTRGNTVTCRADQYWIYLGTGDIIAIVLGIILLIILIAVVVFLICRCCKRRKSVNTVPIPRKKRDQQ